jgi:hypothetical protein
MLATINAQSYQSSLQQAAFDRIIGPTNLYASNYSDIFNSFPDVDPAILFTQYWCDWGDSLNEYQGLLNAIEELCIFQPNINSGSKEKRSGGERPRPATSLTSFRPHTSPLLKRFFSGSLNLQVQSGMPTIGRLLDAILSGLPLLYTRIISYSGGGIIVEGTLAHLFQLLVIENVANSAMH